MCHGNSSRDRWWPEFLIIATPEWEAIGSYPCCQYTETVGQSNSLHLNYRCLFFLQITTIPVKKVLKRLCFQFGLHRLATLSHINYEMTSNILQTDTLIVRPLCFSWHHWLGFSKKTFTMESLNRHKTYGMNNLLMRNIQGSPVVKQGTEYTAL